MKIRKILMISGFIVVALFSGAYAYVRTTPRYSLYQLRSALENHDPERALLFIDIDSIVDNLVRDTLQKQDATIKDPWQKAGNDIGKGLVMMMAPAMKESLKAQIKSAIASADDKNDMQKLRTVGFWDADIAVNGGSAVLTVNNNGITRFRMIKSADGYWKIIEIIMKEEVAAGR